MSRFASVGVVFTSFAVWHVSNNVEPFALNLALCAAVLWCLASLIYRDVRFPICETSAIVALGLLFGLGFCNHHTQSLLVPMTFLVIAKTSVTRAGFLKDTLFFALGFILGLLPISYFFLTNLDAPMVWGLYEWVDKPVSRLITHLFRREYGTFQLVPQNTEQSRALFMLKSLLESSLYMGLLLCAVASWTAVKMKKEDHANRTFLVICLTINMFPIMLFFLMARAEQGSFYDAILSRFVAMPSLLICPLIALGMDDIREKFKTSFSWPFAFILVSLNIAINLPAADRRLQRLPEFTLKTMLEITKSGFFIGGSDFTWAGVPFLQVVRGIGTDVKLIQPRQIRNKEDRELLFRRMQLPYQNWNSLDDFFEFAVNNGGLTFEFPPVGTSVMNRLYPAGPVYVVGKSGLPDAVTVFDLNENIFKELLKSSLLNKDLLASDWEFYILQYFRQPWTVLRDTLKQNHPDLAEKARAYEHNFLRQDKRTIIIQEKNSF